MSLTARWVNIGLVSPQEFHSTYIGLAEHQSRDDAPILLWGRTTGHICLGQHQYRSVELRQPHNVPVLQRPLGGGTVWVDENQYCFVWIVPLAHVRGRPQQWFEWALAPALTTYREFGLNVVQQDQDIWLDGRKIGGSGAATIGHCAVLAASFLMHFPVDRFVACVACPSEGFRVWLAASLRDAMTDWQSHQLAPQEDRLAHVFRGQVEVLLDWDIADSCLTQEEVLLRQAALLELAELDLSSGKRLIPDGIKLNACTFLTEKHEAGHWVRVLTMHGKFARVQLSRELPNNGLDQIIACVPEIDALQKILEEMMPQDEACYWAGFIMRTAYFQ